MKQPGHQPFSAVLFFFAALTTVFLLLGVFFLYAYRQEQTQHLTRSLDLLADEVIRLNLYHDDPESVKKSFALVDTYGHIPHEGLTFAYHPRKPKPVKGAGVIKKLPDGRYLTLYSSLKHINERTAELALQAGLFFGVLLLFFAFAFGMFLKSKKK